MRASELRGPLAGTISAGDRAPEGRDGERPPGPCAGHPVGARAGASRTRRATRVIYAGEVPIGAPHPVVVQSMAKVDPHDAEAVARQADELAELGAGLVRLAVPDKAAAEAIAEVRRRSRATLVADIHYDPRLAIAAIEAGAHKIRVNPGNLRGGEDAVRAIAEAAARSRVPIRVGANSGSLSPAFRDRASTGTEAPGEALALAVLEGCRAFERANFRELVVSAKGSDVISTIGAARLLAARTEYPVHIGLTAAGIPELAWAKSAVAIGALLAEGIGDTVRVSYTGPPHEEVAAARAILEAVGLVRSGPEIVSCPTCGRTRVDLVRAVEAVREALRDLAVPLRVAVMGCEVNGPGEARDSDVGLACGREGGWLFARGERLRRVREAEMVQALVELAREEAARLAPAAPEGVR